MEKLEFINSKKQENKKLVYDNVYIIEIINEKTYSVILGNQEYVGILGYCEGKLWDWAKDEY